MLYFLDTEFIEDGETIDLISIGLVAEDGREYYAVNEECKFCMASPWVWNNVLDPMEIKIWSNHTFTANKETTEALKSRNQIAKDIIEFVGETTPEFWSDYAAYDWVVLCQLFGTMVDLPTGFPMYCNDIQQLRTYLGYRDIEPPTQVGIPHNALEDAKYVKKLWEYYSGLMH